MSHGQDPNKYQGRILDTLLLAAEKNGTTREIRSRGLSMHPFIRSDEEVLIRHCPASAARTGDVVVFRSLDTVMVHRLVKKVDTAQGLRLYEKGDNTLRIACVPAELFLGRVEAVRTERGVIDLRRMPLRVLGLVVALWGRAVVRLVKALPGGLVEEPSFGRSSRSGRSSASALAGVLTAPTHLMLRLSRRLLARR